MAEEYIKYIRDLEGVSRPVRDAELAEEVANIDTDVGDKIDEINRLIDSLNSQISSINTNISSLQSSVSSINTSITSINSDLTSVKTGGAVQRVGTSNVGSATKPIYLDGGTPKASDADVGTFHEPMFLNNGTFATCRGDYLLNVASYTCQSDYLNFEESQEVTVDFTPATDADAYIFIPTCMGYGTITNFSYDIDNSTITLTLFNNVSSSTKHTVAVRFYLLAYHRAYS